MPRALSDEGKNLKFEIVMQIMLLVKEKISVKKDIDIKGRVCIKEAPKVLKVFAIENIWVQTH